MAKQKFIDIGANLTDPVFRGIYRGKRLHVDDFTGMLRRAWTAGVTDIIVTGGSLEESSNAVELCKSSPQNGEVPGESPRLCATVGCHPTRSAEMMKETPQEYIDGLTKLIRENAKHVVAYGEFGLDYDRLQFADKNCQLEAFERQLSNLELISPPLPLFLHCRAASKDFYDAMKRHRNKFKDGVVHSFDGTVGECQQLLDLGLHIGINGCSLKTKENLDVAKFIPINRLMIETDCPYCEIKPTHASFPLLGIDKKKKLPEPSKFVDGCQVRSRNEPCNIVEVFKVIAALRGGGESPDQLAEIIYENTRKVFFGEANMQNE